MRWITVCAAAALLTAGAAPSYAAYLYNIQFTDTNGDAGNLNLTTNNAISPTGALVVGLTGTFDGNSVFLTDPTATCGGFNCSYQADDLLSSASPFFDQNGLGFYTTPGGGAPVYFGLFGDGSSNGLCFAHSCQLPIGGQDSNNYLVTITSGPVAVPEPAAWGLMLAGFAGTGLMMRSRRRKEAGALAA